MKQYVQYPVIIQKATIHAKTIYLVKIGPLQNQQQVSRVEHALGSVSI